MAFNETELMRERQYLERVIHQIQAETDDLKDKIEKQHKTIVSSNNDFKEDVPILNGGADFDQVVEIFRFNDMIYAEEKRYEDMKQRLTVLRKMYDSAYFGRVDFLEDGEKQADTYYIGISTLRDDKGNFLVIDWRAPISSLYYEFETGKCSYLCPAGKIEGELLQKRQYGIFRNRFDYMFETDVLIEDKLLCKMLSESHDSKMGNIVRSIQKEQNDAIRHNEGELLIIFGPAGSGKTSVAMHRAAYLLYKHRETIKSENILLLSPNNVFKDYISDVLPDLGERNVNIYTTVELYMPLLTRFKDVETHGVWMEAQLCGQKGIEDRKRRVQFKNSPQFLQILKEYAKFIDNNTFAAEDIYYGDTLIFSAQEMNELFTKDWAHMTYAQRLKRISSKVYAILEEVMSKRRRELEIEHADLFEEELRETVNNALNNEFASVKSKIDRLFSVDSVSLYANMYQNREFYNHIQSIANMSFEEFQQLFNVREYYGGLLRWEDVFPLLFVKCIISGETIELNDRILFIFIDEFQDIPPVGLYVIKNTFKKASMTIVGDVNQSVDSVAAVYTDAVLKLIFEDKNASVLRLTKSYRSTREISDYTEKIIPCDNVEYMNRHGSQVTMRNQCSFTDKVKEIADEIPQLKEQNLNSVAIICKTRREAEKVHEAIKGLTPVGLITREQDRFGSGAVVIPSYLSKGLEFDAVYVFDGEAYNLEQERRLYYTVCTRALHKLLIYNSPVE